MAICTLFDAIDVSVKHQICNSTPVREIRGCSPVSLLISRSWLPFFIPAARVRVLGIESPQTYQSFAQRATQLKKKDYEWYWCRRPGGRPQITLLREAPMLMCREAQTQPEREQTIVFSGVESSTRPRFIRGCIPPKKKKKKKKCWRSTVLGRPPPLSSARWLVMRLLIVLIRIQTDATRRRTAVKPTGNRHHRRRRRIASSYKHDVRDDDRASFRNRTTALGAPGGPLFHPCLTSERIRKDAWVIAETNGRMGLQRNTHTHIHTMSTSLSLQMAGLPDRGGDEKSYPSCRPVRRMDEDFPPDLDWMHI